MVAPLCLIENEYQMIAHGSYIGLLIMSTYFFRLGESNFDRYPFKGPYHVGHKLIRSTEYDNEISVFYPIDKNAYVKFKDTSKDIDYIDKKTFEHFKIGLSKTVTTATKNPIKPPGFFLNTLLKIKTGVISGAPLA